MARRVRLEARRSYAIVTRMKNRFYHASRTFLVPQASSISELKFNFNSSPPWPSSFIWGRRKGNFGNAWPAQWSSKRCLVWNAEWVVCWLCKWNGKYLGQLRVYFRFRSGTLGADSTEAIEKLTKSYESSWKLATQSENFIKAQQTKPKSCLRFHSRIQNSASSFNSVVCRSTPAANCWFPLVTALKTEPNFLIYGTFGSFHESSRNKSSTLTSTARRHHDVNSNFISIVSNCLCWHRLLIDFTPRLSRRSSNA